MTNTSNQPTEERCTFGDLIVGTWKRFNLSPEKYSQIRNSTPAYECGEVWGYLVNEARKERIERKARRVNSVYAVSNLLSEMFDDDEPANTSKKSESNNSKAADERSYYNRSRF